MMAVVTVEEDAGHGQNEMKAGDTAANKCEVVLLLLRDKAAGLDAPHIALLSDRRNMQGSCVTTLMN